MGKTKTIRLYEHEDIRPDAPDQNGDCAGWTDYSVGELVEIDGELYTIIEIHDRIQTGDVRGNYITADVERNEETTG